MLRRNGPVVKSVESVLRLEGSLWGQYSCSERISVSQPVKAKFHYALWFEAGSNQIA